jgi:hypothetical protein
MNKNVVFLRICFRRHITMEIKLPAKPVEKNTTDTICLINESNDIFLKIWWKFLLHE